MNKYDEIKARVEKNGGEIIHHGCYIAYVLSNYGQTKGISPNRKDPNVRKVPCPDSKRPAIEKAAQELDYIKIDKRAIYKDIQAQVKKDSGFTCKICWIAHILFDYGFITKEAPNRIDSDFRQHPCPDDKHQAIVEAMRKLGVLKYTPH